MTPDELKSIMLYLRERVRLGPRGIDGSTAIEFTPPAKEEMISEGLNSDGVQQIFAAPWWKEMVIDIIETPEMCEPEDSPLDILEYAKDVVSEYIRKRFHLEKEN